MAPRGKLRLDLPLGDALSELCHRLQVDQSDLKCSSFPNLHSSRGVRATAASMGIPAAWLGASSKRHAKELVSHTGNSSRWRSKEAAFEGPQWIASQISPPRAASAGALGRPSVFAVAACPSGPGRLPSKDSAEKVARPWSNEGTSGTVSSGPTRERVHGRDGKDAGACEDERQNTAPVVPRRSRQDSKESNTSHRKSSKESSASRRQALKGSKSRRRAPPPEIMQTVEHEVDGQPQNGAMQFSEAVLAHQLRMPLDIVKDACRLFDEFASGTGPKSMYGRSLSRLEFGKVLCELCKVENVKELQTEFVTAAFATADCDHGGSIDIEEFVRWYSLFGFSEEVVLSQGQQGTRNLARELGIEYIDIERYKRAFDDFDTDCSGVIELGEFEQLLCKLLKVPRGETLPKQRVMRMWRQADANQTGGLDFASFAKFYHDCFDMFGDGQRFDFEDFYHVIRPTAF
eukprot:TRINITY_DN24143_c0_g1_i1.p1 TRINITY_DN24143_c0_g1~~TRINITY_DN24143_c0_g1_i1.p1  ORF type:complete len:488 (+),score=73.89 TRINITY_DN24143_c0_g1_i1:85-1464(+)